MPSIDWSRDEERKEFENDLAVYRATKKNYSLLQWLRWFSGVVLLPALLVLAFYGPVGYTIVNDARQEKIEKEEAMNLEWLELRQTNLTADFDKINFENLTDYLDDISFANMTGDLGNISFVYNDTILNTIKRNFYFLTVPCQGTAFIAAVAFHYTDYKKWNFLGTVIAGLCLPVDMLIFYVEPIGFVGTLSAMVLGFVPFAITISDAVYPEKVVKVRGLKGKILTVHKNSWTKHLSLTFNQRYNLVVRMTAAGYMFFATVALVITLVKGDGEQFYLGILVLVVEGMPQLLVLAMVMTHWHGDFNTAALSFFITFVDIPLILWYLSFYCDERTKYVVIGKIINLAIANSAEHWAEFVESYIYNEEDINVTDDADDTATGKGYNITKPLVVVFYQLGYILASPVIGLGEILNGFKDSMTRDFGWFKKDHHIGRVVNIKRVHPEDWDSIIVH